MKTNGMLLGLAAVALGAILSIPARAGDAQQDSAKQEKPKTRHVITNDDLPSAGESVADTSSDAAADEKKADEKPMSADDVLKEYEKYKYYEESLTKKLETIQAKADEADDPVRKQMYLDMIDHQQVTLKEFHDKRVELEKKVSTMKEKQKDKEKAKETEKPKAEPEASAEPQS